MQTPELSLFAGSFCRIGGLASPGVDILPPQCRVAGYVQRKMLIDDLKFSGILFGQGVDLRGVAPARRTLEIAKKYDLGRSVCRAQSRIAGPHRDVLLGRRLKLGQELLWIHYQSLRRRFNEDPLIQNNGDEGSS